VTRYPSTDFFSLAFLLLIAALGLQICFASPQKTAASGKSSANKSARSAPVKALFRDVTEPSGIKFHLTCGGAEKRYIMESMCGGVAVFDYDNDGWMDILLVDGSTLADMQSGVCHLPKLYRNNRNGTFTDVSSKSGINRCGWGFGVAVGDYDNDGWQDVYITYLDGGALYHNDHNGSFSDITAKAGVDNHGAWGTSTAFGDYDNDGNLDLYAVNYVELDLGHLPEFGKGPFCQYRGIPVSCGPRGLKGSRDRLYHNNGNGTFTDVTEKLNIDPDSYYGLGVLWFDYDKDGCMDLYVADDSTPSQLYHNNCRGGFTEVGASAGVAYSADGREQAGMGVDSSDYDRDGWPDLVKTNFSDDTNNLYHNDHDGQFTDVSGPSGFGPMSVPFLGFGVKFFDLDNDGWPDLFIANGHVNPQVDSHSFGVTYAQRPFLFRNLGNGRFEELGMQSGPDLKKTHVARGLAVADFLNTGKLDLLFTVLDGSPVLLRNEVQASGHWLRLKAVGTHSNRDGLGARVEVTAGNVVQVAEVRANSSFESASDPRLHFGLGRATRLDSVVIRWPSGRVDHVGSELADQELVIEEGKGVVLRKTAPTSSPRSVRRNDR
jgi:enediyne biosynthesis protein E4